MNKRTNHLSILFFCIFLFFLFSCSKQSEKEKNEVSSPAVAYASVDKVETTIGDMITFNLNLDYAEGIKIQYPDIKKYLDDFMINSEKREKPKLIDNRLTETFTYKLQVKEIGSYIIKPIEIKYYVPKELESKFGKNGIVKTSKIFIEIKSVLKPEDKNKDIEDIKPLEKITYLSKTLIAGIILVIILLIPLIYFILKKLRKPEKVLLPHELAFQELSNLKEQKILEKEEFKTFYFRLSEILRRYLKNRFEILALEKVSNEVVDDINKIEEIPPDKKIFLKAFLETTDFYKFTDASSSITEASQLFEKSYSFVNETMKIPEPVEKKG